MTPCGQCRRLLRARVSADEIVYLVCPDCYCRRDVRAAEKETVMGRLTGRIRQLTLEGVCRPTGAGRRYRVVNAVATFDDDGREITAAFVWPREKDVPPIRQAVTLTFTSDTDG